jgi:type II restriction enzyme
LDFFNISWLKNVFKNKYISNLEDYVFWVETWLDSNARKNRTWDLMEDLVEELIKDLCNKNTWFEYKEQATASFIQEKWWIDVKSDKSSRRFDFAIFDKNQNKVFLIEVNYYWWGWSKLKAVAWEFAWLYNFMKKQNIKFYWITDWLGRNTAKKPLEESYNKMDWNIYNINMLKEWILTELIK